MAYVLRYSATTGRRDSSVPYCSGMGDAVQQDLNTMQIDCFYVLIVRVPVKNLIIRG